MSTFIVFVYSNGREFEGPHRLTFEGDKRPIQIKCSLSYDTLNKNIGAKLKLQSHQIISSLTYKSPIAQNSSTYIAVEIVDDDDVECMIDTFEQNSTVTLLELYVEIDVTCSSSLLSPPIHSGAAFSSQCNVDTSLLNDDEDWLWDLSI